MALIISTDKLPPKALESLTGSVVIDVGVGDKDLGASEVLITWPNKLAKETLVKATKLRAVQFLSAGVDEVPYSIIPRNIRLFSNADAFSISVAEHAWALILALAKNVNKADEKSESRRLFGRTLVVLGCGGIGSEVARIGKGFGMQVIGVSRSFLRPEYLDEKKDDISHLDLVLTRADVLVCALPVNKVTRNLLNYENLSRAKVNSIIVNVSRAEVFEKDGLLRFLRERPETRYGTDVFWRKDGKEIFDSKLMEMRNFLGTKHKAGLGASVEARNDAFIRAAENVSLFVKTGNANNEIKVSDYI